SSRSNAENAAETFGDTFEIKTNIHFKDNFYKVQTENFTTRSEAEKLKEQIEAKGWNSFLIENRKTEN
ncbi:MAG: SPOR domain-containing protein, partial [Prolixibacteraceae bacterium]